MDDKELVWITKHPYFWAHDVYSALHPTDFGFKRTVVPQSVEDFNKHYGTRCNRKDLKRLLKMMNPKL